MCARHGRRAIEICLSEKGVLAKKDWETLSKLTQICCSYSRTHNIQNGFLHFLLLFLRSTLFVNRSKHIGEEFFVLCKFAFPAILLLTSALTLSW